MKKNVLILCVLLVFTALFANTELNLQQNFAELTNEEWGEFSREMTSHIRDLRDLYMLEVLHEEWTNEAWEYVSREVYTYDGNGFAIEMLGQAWLVGEWENGVKMLMTNNVEGYPVETLYQIWEPTLETWTDMLIMTFTYDTNWNMLEMLNQMWFGTEWMNRSRFTMTYNTDDNPTYELNEVWDMVGEVWGNSDQRTYTYDGLFLEEILEEAWENNSEWIWSGKITYTLEGNYHPADRLEQGWDLVNWNNQRYSQYTYDVDWHEIEDYEQEWIDSWINFEWKFSTYNADGFMTELLTQRWFGARNWENYHRYTITYGTLDSDDNTISPNNDLLLSNYPNPFNPTTTISFSLNTEISENTKLVIYNLKGQKIRQFPILNSQSSVVWDGTDEVNKPVSSGIYFYKLRTDNLEETKKMILMK